MEAISVDIRRGAEITGLSVQTIRNKIRAGELKASRIGRRIVIPVTELEKLVRMGIKTR